MWRGALLPVLMLLACQPRPAPGPTPVPEPPHVQELPNLTNFERWLNTRWQTETARTANA